MTLTPTEQKIYDILADGFQHSSDELVACLWDELNDNPLQSVKQHVSNLRKSLGPNGLDVIVRGINGRSTFRLVRFIGAGE